MSIKPLSELLVIKYGCLQSEFSKIYIYMFICHYYASGNGGQRWIVEELFKSNI